MSESDDLKKFVHEAIGAIAGEAVGEVIDTSEVFTEDQSSGIGDVAGYIVERFLNNDDESED